MIAAAKEIGLEKAYLLKKTSVSKHCDLKSRSHSREYILTQLSDKNRH